jgi:hypothetical protein
MSGSRPDGKDAVIFVERRRRIANAACFQHVTRLAGLPEMRPARGYAMAGLAIVALVLAAILLVVPLVLAAILLGVPLVLATLFQDLLSIGTHDLGLLTLLGFPA